MTIGFVAEQREQVEQVVRVAAGRLVQPRRVTQREPVPPAGDRQPQDVLRRQPAQRQQHGVLTFGQLPPGLGERGAGRGGKRRPAARLVRRHEQHRIRTQVTAGVHERGQRLLVGPLRVVDEYREAVTGPQVAHERVADHGGQGLRVKRHRAVGGADSRQLTEYLAEYAPRNWRIAVNCLHPDNRLPGFGEECVRERALANARLALDGYHAAGAAARRFPRPPQDAELTLACHENSLGRPAIRTKCHNAPRRS